MDGAKSSTDDLLYLTITGPAASGDKGFSAPGLSQLVIYGYGDGSLIALNSVGSEDDPLRLSIGGSFHTTVTAVAGSVNYISAIAISNSAGADISGLEQAKLAFVASGVIVTGGSGDDTLVGGSGSDSISTGGGDNKVFGSGGVDQINLNLNSGLDVLVFDQQSDSAFGSADIVTNFNAFDTIDISELVASVNFTGNVTSLSNGMATLSTSQSRAFFITNTNLLCVDLNHDGLLDADNDLSLMLNGVSSLNGFNLIG